MRRTFSVLVMGFLCAVPAGVNAQAREAVNRGTPNFDLYGGYSYVFQTYTPNTNHVSLTGRAGWDASLKVPLIGPYLGIKGDVSGFYKNGDPQFNPRTYFFLVGPQVGFHFGGRSTLFAHGMIGSAHLEKAALPDVTSGNSMAMAAGGGLDVGVTRWLAWRITGDFYNTHFKANSHNLSLNKVTNSNARISMGPVLRF